MRRSRRVKIVATLGPATDTGAMLFCVRSTSAQLQQYAGDPKPLIRALQTFKDVYILNLPANDPAAAVLRDPELRDDYFSALLRAGLPE